MQPDALCQMQRPTWHISETEITITARPTFVTGTAP
jgi:hypothetical protein